MIDFNKLNIEDQDLIFDIVGGACIDIDNNEIYSSARKHADAVFEVIIELFGTETLNKLIDKHYER